MKQNYYNSCYNLAAMSTCIINDNLNNELWYYGASKEINITDTLSALTKYAFLGSDYISSFDYEIHYFSIDFFKNGKLLETVTFEKKFNEKKFGSLANPNLDLSTKLNTINDMKPGVITKLRMFSKNINLSENEINAVVNFSNELKNSICSTKEENKKTL